MVGEDMEHTDTTPVIVGSLRLFTDIADHETKAGRALKFLPVPSSAEKDAARATFVFQSISCTGFSNPLCIQLLRSPIHRCPSNRDSATSSLPNRGDARGFAPPAHRVCSAAFSSLHLVCPSWLA